MTKHRRLELHLFLSLHKYMSLYPIAITCSEVCHQLEIWNKKKEHFHSEKQTATMKHICFHTTWITNLLSCSWLGYEMITLPPSWRRPVVAITVPDLRLLLEVKSVWMFWAALTCFCFLPKLEIPTTAIVESVNPGAYITIIIIITLVSRPSDQTVL